MGSSLLVLVLNIEVARLVRIVGFKLVNVIREVRAVGVHGFKHLQVLSVVPCLLTAIIIHALRVSASEKPNYFGKKLFLFFSSFFDLTLDKRFALVYNFLPNYGLLVEKKRAHLAPLFINPNRRDTSASGTPTQQLIN